MSSRASKKSKSMIKRKTWMRKKKFRVNVQDRSLKKRKQTTATKKQKTVYSSERFRKSLRSFNEKKKERKRNNDQWQSRCHILLRSTKMKENYKKKIEIESVFHVFSTTLQKDELFSFWWPYLCPLALPNPFKPLRMNVNRHYYIKTRKQEKINSHPPQLQKKNVWPAKT